MDNRPSHDELRNELRRRGLPRAYIERLLTELDDHFTDLLEERSSPMGAARKLQTEELSVTDLQQRLGEPRQLAIFAAEQYHTRSFWGRHPIVTFVLAPLPLVAVCMISFSLALISFGKCCAYVLEHMLGWKSPDPQDYLMLQGIVMGLTSWYFVVLPPFAAAWLLCRVYRRNALNWRWPALACSLLAIAAGLLSVSYRLATEPNNGALMIGFDLRNSSEWLLFTFLPKFALALGIGLLLVRRAQQQLATAD